jgi:thioredoxin-related protein
MEEKDYRLVLVGDTQVGLIGLKEIFEDIKSQRGKAESDLKQMLVEKVGKKNYIPSSVRVIIKMIEIYEEKELTQINRRRLIPIQIFFDSKNKEVFRHEGFMDKEQIKRVLAFISSGSTN